MKIFAYIFLIFTIIIFNGCNSKAENSTNEETKTKNTNLSKKITIELNTVNAKKITFIKDGDKLRLKNNDKIILLDFFATWCPPCKAEIPHLINLQKKYKNNLKIIGILLESDKPDSEIKSFISYNHINYIIANGENNFKLSNILGGIQNIPFMILYDKNGNLITHYMGIIPEEMIDSDIKKAMEK